MWSRRASLVEYSSLHLLHLILLPSGGLSCGGSLLEPPLALRDTMSILDFNFRPLVSTFPALEVDNEAIVDEADDELFDCCCCCGCCCVPPEFALKTVFRSLDSTFRVLPVESLVMVTEPPEEAEVASDGAEEDDDDVMTDSLADDDDEEEEVDEDEVNDESRTGEMVTLVSFLPLPLLGEEEPKRRPSSSSTLSKADSDVVFEASVEVLVSSAGASCCFICPAREGLS